MFTTMPTRLAALLCAASLLGLAGCAPMPVRSTGINITITNTPGYQPPPGAVPAAASAQPGNYDYSGIAKVTEDGQTVSPEEALNRANLRDALLLGQITSVANPSHVRLHIVVPDHDRLRLLALQPTRGVQNGATEFRAELQRLHLHHTADGVVRSRAFASADIVEENDTVWPDAAGAEDVLWFQVQSARPDNAGPWVGAWQMRRANGSATLAVSLDPGTAPGPARLMSFVRSAQDVAASLAGTPSGLAENPRSRRPGHPFSSGSGIIIDALGHVLTDNHVISNCLDVRVTTAAGTTPVGATLVANDARLDLALLGTGEHAASYARSATARPCAPASRWSPPAFRSAA